MVKESASREGDTGMIPLFPQSSLTSDLKTLLLLLPSPVPSVQWVVPGWAELESVTG